MTTILRLLFRFQTEYSGDPRFVSGNAFRHALSRQVHTSIGIFTDIDRLNPPRTYYEFFLIRTKKCFAFPHFEKFFDYNTNTRKYRFFFTPRFVTFDILDPPPDLIDLISSIEPIQFGGGRHCGCGAVVLHDTLYIDIDAIPMPERATHLVLISPLLHFPPCVEKYRCRRERLNLWNHGRVNHLNVIAPGQFFRIKPGQNIPKIARNGILRRVKANKALFSQFGFGEFILYDWKSGGMADGPR